jgi:hypothetical protein
MIIRVCDPPQLAIGPPIGFAAKGNEFAGWKEPLAADKRGEVRTK